MNNYMEMIRKEEELQSIKETYIMNSFNDVIGESSNNKSVNYYAILEADTKSINSKLSILDKLKLFFNKNNKKFLNKYKESALNVNPIGLTVSEFYIMKTDINTKYKKAIDYIDSIKEEDSKEFADDIQSPQPKNTYWLKALSIISDGDEDVYPMGTYFNKKENYKITRQDIKNAIKVLDSSDEEINKNKKEISTIGDKYLSDSFSMMKNKKISIELRKVKQAKLALIYLITDLFIRTKVAQLKEIQKQSRSIVYMAANHNPRNIKESSIVTEACKEYSDYIFDMQMDEIENFQ